VMDSTRRDRKLREPQDECGLRALMQEAERSSDDATVKQSGRMCVLMEVAPARLAVHLAEKPTRIS
jgi:hypothetical protein